MMLGTIICGLDTLHWGGNRSRVNLKSDLPKRAPKAVSLNGATLATNVRGPCNGQCACVRTDSAMRFSPGRQTLNLSWMGWVTFRERVEHRVNNIVSQYGVALNGRIKQILVYK